MPDNKTRVDGFDIVTNPLFVHAGLRRFSIEENAYYLGEKEKHPIEYNQAIVDWGINRHKGWFSKAFNKNKEYIFKYMEQHRNEIAVENNQLRFTREQFEHLMLQDHSPNPVGENERLESLVSA